jgi:hypothetical protein
MTETLVQLQNLAVYNLQQVINYAEREQLTHTQEFLDFLDTINGLSVTY